ncbi:MAG: type IV secretion system DNA-binding domain-containing protein [Patescibacteria group bacterium]|nr:type IV secretion system DNA-binding domain-containing protein [Patescibacteria group bacterium]
MNNIQSIDLETIESSGFFSSDYFYLALFFISVFLLFLLIRFFVRYYSVRGKNSNQAIFLVRLPKEKPKDQDKGESLQQLQEEIAKGETVFASIGGLRAQRGLAAWFFGRTDNFSFEIISNKNKISFYITAPKEKALYIEQQIHAHYPEASVEEVEDYNIFNPQGYILAGYLQAKRSFIFPFLDYSEMDSDPMNSLINVMSKLESDESIAVQYVVRSAKKGWHAKIKESVLKAYKSQDVSEIFRISSNSFYNAINFFIYDILLGMFDMGRPEKKESDNGNKKELTEKEREMLKKMEEKNSKAGLDVNLRVVVSAKTKEKTQTYFENISNAFSEYNYYEYGNAFKKVAKGNQEDIINDFIYRHFIDSQSFLLNTEELVSMYHFPLSHTETPNIDWLTSKTAAAPSNLPKEGVLLGFNLFRGIKTDVRIKKIDRRRHMYIIGKSGTGKSVLLNNLAIQDIQNGDGVCVMDPNGDLIEDILNRIPPERAEDVIVFSPSDTERPLGLNLLEYDERYPEQKTFVINEMIGIFDKLYDLKATGGPMFEQYMRNALLLIMDSPETGSTLMEISKVLADEDFRRMKLRMCKNQTVVDFWQKEAEKAGGEAALANMVPYITSKLTPFVSNDMMMPIIGQQKSAFNFRDLMDSRKILMVDLPKGAIGETNAYLLGMIIVGKILMAALSRTDMPAEDRKDFYLYIDEFQNFTTNSICQILSEARKYALCLNIAHQYIGQLSKNQDSQIKDAVFGNVGTMVSFKVGSEDADFLVKEFGPVFNEYDLVNIGRGGFAKLLVDGQGTRPFSLQTIWPLMGDFRQGMSQNVRQLSRYKYGQDRNIILRDIANRRID